ncbi:PepSY domain-containing protein [Streptomyces sp. AS02]|uniref:PepSY domain-containing protein n=1 Tax=Streptomyces sp. AS02 TaxID=2938946 RepID=UPI0020216EDF|nr:PepSY domain-containing protein [Streptomyces sp. AS02]MCL8015578.1 PepSY domain-containing protein [Streptomyces sp. AS02]
MKRNIVIATVAAAALIGGGTVAAYAVGGDESAPTQRQSSVRLTDDRDDNAEDAAKDAADARDDDAVEVREAAGTTKVTAADAIVAALKHTPGTAVSADLDDDGSNAWEVNVVNGDGADYDVRVSADNGKVLGAHRDNDDDNDGQEDIAALKGTTVDAREAAEAAAAKGTVTDVDLDDDGPAAWSVETTKGEYKVDLKTGKVTQVQDDDHDDTSGDDD